MAPILPKGRGLLYSIWKSCERFGIRPPSIGNSWDDCSGPVQSYMLAYEQIRSSEEAQGGNN